MRFVIRNILILIVKYCIVSIPYLFIGNTLAQSKDTIPIIHNRADTIKVHDTTIVYDTIWIQNGNGNRKNPEFILKKKEQDSPYNFYNEIYFSPSIYTFSPGTQTAQGDYIQNTYESLPGSGFAFGSNFIANYNQWNIGLGLGFNSFKENIRFSHKLLEIDTSYYPEFVYKNGVIHNSFPHLFSDELGQFPQKNHSVEFYDNPIDTIWKMKIDTTIRPFNNEYKNNVLSIDIPLSISYNFANNPKVLYSLKAGFCNRLVIRARGNSIPITAKGYLNDLKKSHYAKNSISLDISMSIFYKMSSKVLFYFDFYYRTFLSSIYAPDYPISVYPTVFGTRVGLRFKICNKSKAGKNGNLSYH